MKKKQTLDVNRVRDVSVLVYKMRLEAECKGNVDRMIEKDGDAGEKLRARAAAYDALTRCYLTLLERRT